MKWWTWIILAAAVLALGVGLGAWSSALADAGTMNTLAIIVFVVATALQWIAAPILAVVGVVTLMRGTRRP